MFPDKFHENVNNLAWISSPMGFQRLLYLQVSFIFSRRRQWHPTPVLLPGKSYGRRSLEGCSLWVAEGQTRLSAFTFTFTLSFLV